MHGWIAAERSLGERVSAVVQYSLATPVVRGIGNPEVDWPSGNLVFGVTGRSGEKWRWDVSFQEDIPVDSPAIDFTLGLRVSRSW